MPGLDEVFALADLADHAESGDWDVIVVDCAPTAETLRLLSLPDVLGWYVDRLFPVGRRLNKVVGPVLGRVTIAAGGRRRRSSPPASRFFDRLDGGARRSSADPSAPASAWWSPPSGWWSPRPAAPTPTCRCSATASTRWWPTGCCPTPSTTRGSTSGRPRTPSSSRPSSEGFAPVPVLRSELPAAEPIGSTALAAFADDLYGELDPTAVLHEGEPLRVESHDGSRAPGAGAPVRHRTSCRSPAATTSSSSASAPTGGRSCCPTRCAPGRSPTPASRTASWWWSSHERDDER